MSILKLEEDSYGYDVNLTAKQGGSVIDITGMELWFIVGDLGSSTLWSGQCSTVGLDPALGQCKFTVPSSLTASPGVYRGELEILTTDKKIECDEIVVAIMPTLSGKWKV